MKVVILAGGFGTRLAEYTEVIPKPMVEVGGKPMLWHIMKHYAQHDLREFHIALGYLGEEIKRYFLHYYSLTGDISIDLANGEVDVRQERAEPWEVHLADTGLETNTGGRLWHLRDKLSQGTFMVTYGDGVADIDLTALLSTHRSRGRLATVTAVRPPARFGGLLLDEADAVAAFTEKPQAGEGWINGGYFVFEPEVLNYLDGDGTSLEAEVLERLADEGQLTAYRHDGFWQCMDTKRDLDVLRRLWNRDDAPWKVWA
jgi:glucose-1-phosphate cytidylyltransferase